MKRSLLIILVLCGSIYAETIQRDRTALRQGPGAWHPMLFELTKGSEVSVLRTEGNWVYVAVENEKGYISAKSLVGKSSAPDVFASMSNQKASTRVSHSAISAAVKGFADRFSRKLNLNPHSTTFEGESQLSDQHYQVFAANTISPKKLKKLNKQFKLKKLSKDKPFSFSEEGSGLAIAAKLKSAGLVSDPDLVAYVNNVGAFVAERSHGYDIHFTFYILDQDGVNGYACPGGIVFITRGALELMRSEAELACFLGHEISHVVYRHGMKEMEERKEMIMADNVFDEMNDELDVSDETIQLSHELDDLALNAYETIFHGRLSNYEEEADEVGLLYAARAGYDPKAMISLLDRVGKSNSVAGAEHYSVSQNKLRIKRIKSYLKQKPFKGKQGLVLHEKRFMKHH